MDPSTTTPLQNQNSRCQNHLHRKQQTKHKSEFWLPKSSPKQLLVHQKHPSQTKLQAFANIVDDLEASVKNGIQIEDPGMFSSLLETSFLLEAIEQGIHIHLLIPKTLLRRNVGISSKLLRLYASNGYIEEAHQVFDYMSNRNLSAFYTFAIAFSSQLQPAKSPVFIECLLMVSSEKRRGISGVFCIINFIIKVSCLAEFKRLERLDLTFNSLLSLEVLNAGSNML
ncbi:hypothetical protein L2E82_14342 [Cichorium intybus]|uniref:Uncharacterized protein n=1 Tax=Cichorium intybus TaxID=13427 RepID=A0ACB9F064_CICIN|nr:hypothetical protein L2E82_14342 [Cichorium intybus]